VKFGACFMAFMQRFARTRPGGVVTIDGRTLRRPFDRAAAASPLHLVSAWAVEQQRLVLGQLAVDGRSNEITAVPRLLAMLARRARTPSSRPMPSTANAPSPSRS
jgi:hypothetical protein